MTSSMIITLLIVVGMVAVIISDKLPFGAPPLIAAALLVLTNQVDVATAFSGFVDKNVILIMGFMVAMAALNKTKLIYDIKEALAKFATKGGVKGLLVLIFGVMVVGNFITGTAFYVLVLGIVATIPANDKLPTARIILPAAIATQASMWLPTSVVIFASIAGGLVESAGYTGGPISTMNIVYMNLIFSALYLVWVFVGHRLLPARNVEKAATTEVKEEGFTPVLSSSQQNLVYLGYAILLGSMIFLSRFPGEIGYSIPMVLAGVFLVAKVISFKEFLGNMFSPLMIMMASVIGVAAAMNNSGLSAYIGAQVAGMLGASPSLLTIVLVFAFLTSILATFTGASFGSLFVTAPIGIALSMQYGFSPVPVAIVCTLSAWINFIMPIDGMPALTFGMGKYKLTEFWKFTIPVWFGKIVLFSVLAVAFFG